jgi:hypothetical protein
MKDMHGYGFTLGCKVARPVLYGKSPFIEIAVVTRIENGKLYLNESKQPMKHPERLLITEHDKLYKLIQDYEQPN